MRIRKAGDKREVRLSLRRRFRTVAEAMAFRAAVQSALAEARRRHRNRERPCCSILLKLDEFLADSRAGLGRWPCNHQTALRHRRRLLAFSKAFQHLPLDAIDRERLERWIKRRLAEGVERDTVNADLISLRAFARWAQGKGYAPATLPIMAVDKLHATGKLAGKNRKPPKAMAMGEMLRRIGALDHERRDMGLFLMGMVLFGLRPAAVAALRRSDAVLPRGDDPGRLHVVGLKGAPDRDIPIPSGSAREDWIKTCLAFGALMFHGKVRPSRPLLPCVGGRSKLNPGGWTTGAFDMALSRLCGALKFRFTAYQVRHTTMTWLLRHKDVALANSQHFAGHTRIDTQNAYNDLIGAEAEAAFVAVDRYINRNRATESQRHREPHFYKNSLCLCDSVADVLNSQFRSAFSIAPFTP